VGVESKNVGYIVQVFPPKNEYRFIAAQPSTNVMISMAWAEGCSPFLGGVESFTH
jgi:hypothetical protein